MEHPSSDYANRQPRSQSYPRARHLEFYLLFIGILLAGVFGLGYWARNQWEQAIQTADLALAQSIALQIDDVAVPPTDWLNILAADREIVLVLTSIEEQMPVHQFGGEAVPVGADWERWQRQIVQRTPDYGSGIFTASVPDGQAWFIAYAVSPDKTAQVIVQRPSPTSSSPIIILYWGLAATVGFYILTSLIYLLYLFNKIITPLEKLDVFSGLVRWRGKLHPEEQSYLEHLARRNDQVGMLAHSLNALSQDIEARFVQLRTLLEISRVVASSLDAGTVIDNILDQVQTLFQVERCAVIALDRRVDVFRIRASRGLSEAYVSQLRIAPTMPNSTSMRALRNQIPIQVSDTETDLSYSPFRPRARAEGFRSVLAIPLLTQQAPPAVLLLYKSEAYRYSFSELEMASSFANHAAIAMENAVLHERSDVQLQEQTRQLEAIVESLNDGLILESMTGQILYCNWQAVRLARISRRDAERETAVVLLSRLLKTAKDQKAVEKIIAGDMGDRIIDFTRKLEDGRSQDLRLHFFDVTDAQGNLIGRGQLWQDITSDKELDRMKSALLSTVSHELRTPLAAIKGYASTLLADDVEWDAASQREFLQTISGETDRLTLLVENLLDMSRIEAGTLPLHLAPCTIKELVDSVVMQVCEASNPRLTVQLPDELPPIWVDASRIETVIRNLLENAVKYTSPDSQIKLSAHQANGSVIIQVRDYGPGIPDDLHDKIFDRFFRADSRLTATVGGAGLGLAICKGFVEVHDGRIWASDGNPGTIISFSLPIKEKIKTG